MSAASPTSAVPEPPADGPGAPPANGADGRSAAVPPPSEGAANGACAPFSDGASTRSATAPEPPGNGVNGAEAPSADGANGRDTRGRFTKGNAGPRAYRNGAPPPNRDPGGTAERTGERDFLGRFAWGNTGGPGNPFMRRTAALRRALLNAVSDQDMGDVALQLVMLSRSGDVAAIKLLLAYTIGKPTAAVDPDSLNLKELQLYQQSLARPEEVNELLRRMPPEFYLFCLRLTLPSIAGTLLQRLVEEHKEVAPGGEAAAVWQAGLNATGSYGLG